MSKRPETNDALNAKVTAFINDIKKLTGSDDDYQPAKIVLNNGRFVYTIQNMYFSNYLEELADDDITQTERIAGETYDKIKELAQSYEIIINLDLVITAQHGEKEIGNTGAFRGFRTNLMVINAEFTIPRPRGNTNG